MTARLEVPPLDVSPLVETPFEVTFVCPDCGAQVERTIAATRRGEIFACVAPCTHLFAEPADLWETALALLRPQRQDAA